ncbi:MAG: polyprenyl synthetase family protein [Gammaproteobacteria bacterium]|nr:polyprenyl synthetase family protein [Gammaproteobacteria bacterium]
MSNQTPVIDHLYALLKRERAQVDQIITDSLHSEVVLINQVSHYIINSGGKRLRPILLLLAARLFEYRGSHHLTLAAVIEFIHTATLLHDDVVDGSELRRGQETVNTVWGNASSVLVGDFLYSRAFQMMVSVGNMRVMDILAETTNTIAEGEVMQLINIHNPDLDEAGYLEVIASKTAKLFEASARLGAVLCQRSGEEEQAIAAYGRHLGVAFQLIDDALDYSASAEQLGKNIGDDLAEGKPTLPLIYTIHHGSAEAAAVVTHAIENGGSDNIDAVMKAIQSNGAIDYTIRAAEDEATRATEAIATLPSSETKAAMLDLARFAVERSY